MSTKAKLLQLLDERCGQFVSGQTIASEMGISRAAINKAAKSLKASGYKILSRRSQGYMLLEKSDILTADSISSHLKTSCKVTVFNDHLDANIYKSRMHNKESENLDVSVISTLDGDKLTISLSFVPSFTLAEAPLLSMGSAVSICNAIYSTYNMNPKIKWVNAIFYDNEQICSTNSYAKTNIETGKIDSFIITMSIKNFKEQEQTFSKSLLVATVINNMSTLILNFRTKSFMPEYRRRCFILGKEIYFRPLGSTRNIKARAIDIDDTGGLVIEYMEGLNMREMHTVRSGQVFLESEIQNPT